MLSEEHFRDVVARAALAPSTHNTQPARWALSDGEILIACDPAALLPVGDPTGRDAGLSCGAALEATVLALSAKGLAAEVGEHWAESDMQTLPGLRLAARIRLRAAGSEDGLHAQLERRFTWRGMFGSEVDLFGWDRRDAVLLTDPARRAWLAELNDAVSHDIMQDGSFRRELLAWMRLGRNHPRYAFDGLNRDAMRMSGVEAFAAPLALGGFWGLLRALGQTRGLVAEAEATLSAPVIACFFRPVDESPVESGRAYLRMCLEAASLGMAGWPMAALSDHEGSNAEICDRLGIGAESRLVQVIRFGKPMGQQPVRARRPLSELLA